MWLWLVYMATQGLFGWWAGRIDIPLRWFVLGTSTMAVMFYYIRG